MGSSGILQPDVFLLIITLDVKPRLDAWDANKQSLTQTQGRHWPKTGGGGTVNQKRGSGGHNSKK